MMIIKGFVNISKQPAYLVQRIIRIAPAILLTILPFFSGCEAGLTHQSPIQSTIRPSISDTFDIWISNVRIHTGDSLLSDPMHVLISQDTIAHFGQIDTTLLNYTTRIEGLGMICTPGFIDLHAHGNPLKTPEFENFLSMGVTTICLGQDGTSPNFDDLSEWMSMVEARIPSVNIIPFVGHGTLRLLSDVLYKKSPSATDYNRMNKLLTDAMEKGAFGMSTGLEYSPGRFAGAQELETLAKIIGQHDGLIMSHMRDEDDHALASSIRELAHQGSYCQVHISHLKSVYGKGSTRAEQIIELIDSIRASGIAMTADLYPYLASYTGLSILFPSWAKPPNDYQQVVSTRRDELHQYLYNKVNQRNGPEATLFGSGKYKGQSLLQAAEIADIPFPDLLIQLGPSGGSAAYFIMDEALQDHLLLDSIVAIGSDGSPTMYHPRGYGSFAKVLSNYVSRKSLLTLENAIHKMTGFSADILGLDKRGRIAVGKKADLLIFDPQKVRDRATFEDPYQLAEGFTYVIVNGQIAKHKNSITPTRNGKVLRKTKQ